MLINSAREIGWYFTSSFKYHARFQFSTHASAGGNIAPSSPFDAGDIRIYRANDSIGYSANQRGSSSGITMTSPFDSLIGLHDVDIDLSDDTDLGFYAFGYRYSVILSTIKTVDGQTISGVVIAEFEIGYPHVNVSRIGNSSQSLDDLKDFADNGYDPATNTILISSAERNSVADAILDRANGIETGVTLRQSLQRVGSVVAGKISGAGTGTEIFVGLDGVTVRATVTVDSSGNRANVIYG